MPTDEPTSGLDPETRRKIWEILLELRKHKTILLTTHFLEEADILGDSIAIMYDGKVKCCGSTIFLKKLYHVGYLLRVQCGQSEAGGHLADLIKQHIPDAFLENQRENEQFYRLTVAEAEAKNLNLMIARLLDAFESAEIKRRYAIEAYGLTNTTLEDVFIKIGTLDAPENAIAMEERVEDHPLHNLQRLAGLPLYAQQFWAIQCKKLKMNYKNLPLFFQSIYLVLPLIILVLMIAFGIRTFTKTDDVEFDTISLRQLKGKEILIVRNAGIEDTDLFRPDNLRWLSDEFGLSVVESKENTSQAAIAEQMLKWTRSGLKNRLVVLPEHTGATAYRVLTNSLHMPHSLIGSMEMMYRLVAREANQQNSDFGVNLKFNYFRPDVQAATGSSDEDRAQALNKTYGGIQKFAILRMMCAILVTLFISQMFSFPFVAFVELPHEEMNSGVSLSFLLSCAATNLF